MNVRPIAFAAVSLILLTACSEEMAGPVAGTLQVNLETPNPDDGAILFTISGAAVDSVTSSGYQVYSARLDSNTLRIIVSGALSAGPVARVYIPDTRQIPNYSVTLNQVAARDSYQQRDPSTDSISLAQ